MFQDVFKFTRAVNVIKFLENLTVKSIGNLIFKLDVVQYRNCIGGGLLEKVLFLVNIECCPEYLEYALHISLLVSLVFKWFVKVGDDVSVNFLC